MYAMPWQNDMSMMGGYGGGYGNVGYAPMSLAQYFMPQQPQSPEQGMLKSFAGARYNLSPTNLAPMQDIASQMGALSKASYDPNDPLFQQLYESERGNNMMDLSSAIAEMTRQNRKLSGMGRTPLFDPERGGEQVFRTLATGYTQAQDNARNRAREIIGAGQGALGRAYDAHASVASAKDTNKKKQAFGIGNIADMLPLLGKMF